MAYILLDAIQTSCFELHPPFFFLPSSADHKEQLQRFRFLNIIMHIEVCLRKETFPKKIIRSVALGALCGIQRNMEQQ